MITRLRVERVRLDIRVSAAGPNVPGQLDELTIEKWPGTPPPER